MLKTAETSSGCKRIDADNSFARDSISSLLKTEIFEQQAFFLNAIAEDEADLPLLIARSSLHPQDASFCSPSSVKKAIPDKCPWQ